MKSSQIHLSLPFCLSEPLCLPWRRAGEQCGALCGFWNGLCCPGPPPLLVQVLFLHSCLSSASDMSQSHGPPSKSVFFFFFFCLFRAAPMAHGGSQTRGRIRATVAGLHHSHSKARSQLSLQPTPRLTAMLDPSPTEQGQGSNLRPHGC